MQTNNPEVVEFINTLTEWHKNRVEQLELITNNRDAGIRLGDRTIEAGSDIAKGIRLGIAIALEQLGKLPFSVTPIEAEEDDGEEKEVLSAAESAKEYCWSNNGEEYHGSFTSIDEALDDYLNTYDVDDAAHVHIGEAKHYAPGSPVSLADDVLEQMNCQAADEAGEHADDWPHLPYDKLNELGQMIQDFVWQHDAPTFYTVENTVLYDVSTRQPATPKPEGV
ncbi:hypothetical protein NH8B_0944 [Pseudogulbenkiania sp. NH8B]|uniref:hypothetical protein n=1 Tax=Pseudogulbenkiania sp. (strain NH8B) TaxID=748280 RepID=UPI0002279A10|nr:hypothetical protein [Pseudogulbenkiania sp. NH8B]BAK75776.1 hypothetical protein NH8B_0944 [Pseudogulbenkiania sp. NH8B]